MGKPSHFENIPIDPDLEMAFESMTDAGPNSPLLLPSANTKSTQQKFEGPAGNRHFLLAGITANEQSPVDNGAVMDNAFPIGSTADCEDIVLSSSGITHSHHDMATPAIDNTNSTGNKDGNVTTPSLATFPTLYVDQHPYIPKLYKTYAEGFQNGAPKALQLQRGKDLAVSLLEHYYPKSQGFTVELAEPINIVRDGWNFWLAPSDYLPFPKRKFKGPLDPDKPFEPGPNPPKVGAKVAEKLTKPAEPVYKFNDEQHHIQASDIISFRVFSEQESYNDDNSNYKIYHPNDADPNAPTEGSPSIQTRKIKKQITHTYLTILLDDLSTFDRWVPTSLQLHDKTVSNPRHDILRYALGVLARISKGYGFLLLGPRFEAYTYDWQGPRVLVDPDATGIPKPIEYRELMSLLGEPLARVSNPPTLALSASRFVKDADPEPMELLGVVDIRTDGLEKVGELFGELVERDVVYQEGFVCQGSRLDRGHDEEED